MCDKIKPGDGKFDEMLKLMEDHGCKYHHEHLEACLKVYEKDWRKCQKEVELLGHCLSGSLRATGYKP